MINIDKFIGNIGDNNSNLEKLIKIVKVIDSNDLDIDKAVKIINESKKFQLIIENVIAEYNLHVIDNDDDLFKDNKIKLFVTAYNLQNNNNEIDNIDNIDNFDDYYLSDRYDSIGIYMRELNYPILSYDEMIVLSKKMHSGDLLAREKIIKSNLRLVVSRAAKYISKCGENISFADIIEEGNIGLIKAVDKYDESLGFKFSSYAINWIDQYICSYIEKNCRSVRLPNYINVIINKYNYISSSLMEKEKREVSREFIRDYIGISIEEDNFLHYNLMENISLNSYVKNCDEDSTELGDFIASEVVDYDKVIDQQKLKFILPEYLKSILDDDEYVLLKYYYSFGLKNGISYEEIGKKYNVSGEAIRLKIAGIIRKIRKDKNIKFFAEYMEDSLTAIKNIDDYRKMYKESYYAYKSMVKKVRCNHRKENKKNDINITKLISKIDYAYYALKDEKKLEKNFPL